MRSASVGTGLAALTILAAPAWAEPLGPAYQVPARPMSLVSEMRIGATAHDPWGRERGAANLSSEILFAKPFTPADLFTSYFVPRPHVGASLNFDGRTSYGYAGLTWSIDLTPRIFIEASVGGALHNAPTGPLPPPPDRTALGCSPAFRESGSVGVRLGGQWSLVATIEHLTNVGLCAQNRGLTNIGARLGYTF
ncbi:MAG TPA: acyloxyacyl hydrolase [Beijerinckiaceae bacterium]|nr:acyloxyacyl hydrolase [Beijerinckiaceae bacterium]